ncbi:MULTISPECIES: hypothetical protein [unclassified Frankia]|uniref:hypothetical protein n=1 Tax=unclassified Frankia TaxID=2632575 RepID=UPI002AD51A11|nr:MULTISPECIES: hypothetical protein [unclassified Frankia]
MRIGQPVTTLVALQAGGWACLRPDGSYTISGEVDDNFWWAIKLCRFGPGELDPYTPAIRALAPAALIPFSMPVYPGAPCIR